MIFGNAVYLWWLLLVLGLIVLEVFLFKKHQELLLKLFPGELKNLMLKNWNKNKHIARIALFILAIFFLSISLSRPQWGKKTEITDRRGIDVIIAIDTSKSMLAEDIKPNRLENAKTSLALLTEELAGNRVSLVAFAGRAFVQCPLTTDIEAIKLFLNSIDTNLIPNPGTNIKSAIDAAVKAFGKTKNSKALILLTDGEELDGNALSGADEAANNHIQIYAIGIGSLDGATIPVFDNRGNRVGVKKDKGEVVVSRANPELLNMLAKKTKGRAFMISDGE
ncbi:MAG: VWA domain-containing protein, partial [Candidatus Margulisbacteria bacterium]|nr:VWA domain-containing protein [Candidatus Margulisiibacteriota bacterium]